jgi:hypothetical protein
MRPSLVLAAAPREPVAFKDFFGSGSNSPRMLLEHPGELRYGGWDMQTLDIARIVKGEYLEVRNGDAKQIQLYEDGTLLAKLAADENFLAWGSKDPDLRLNPLALLEVLFNFVHLYSTLTSRMQTPPREVNFREQIEHAWIVEGSAKLCLSAYGVGSIEWSMDLPELRHHAPEPSMTRDISVATTDLHKAPGRAAYLLAEKIYLWFGMTPDKIPYTSGFGEAKAVDPETFKPTR